MPTFEINTRNGETITLTAKSYLQARTDAHRKLKPGDSIAGISTIKVEKTLPVGYSLVKDVILANELIAERMNEVEASYIRYWNHRREFWLSKTDADINQMFPNRYNSREYYRSEYYQLRNENALTTNAYYVEKWQEKVRNDAKKAKEMSIGNLINAIVKIARNQPITFFKAYNITRGKAGLEGLIQVNDITKRLFAIYAEGPIQRLHIRYLIK